MKSVVTKLMAAGLPIAVLASTASLAPAQRSSIRASDKTELDGNNLHLSHKDCRLELLRSKVVILGATQTGELVSVEPGEVGKLVEAGSIVAEINDAVMQAKLAAAIERGKSDIEVRYAEASHELAKEKYRDALKNQGIYSPAEVMNSKLDYQKTKLQIEKAQVDGSIVKIETEEIRAELKNYKMKAPVTGEVTEVFKRKGESVRQGDDIMQITDLSEVRAVGHIPTKYQGRITKGTKVLLKLLGRNGDPPPFENKFEGKITFIKPKITRISQKFEVYATIINQKDRNGNYILKAGMSNKITVVLDSTPGGDQRAAAQPRGGTRTGARPADYRQPTSREPGRFPNSQK